MSNSILQTFDTKIQNISSSVYYWIIGIIYFLYFVSLMGIAYINPSYTSYLNSFIRIFVAFVLLLRFNYWRKITCISTNDRVIIMASAMFLLINEGIDIIIRQYFQELIQI